jgi:hypothetical protein
MCWYFLSSDQENTMGEIPREQHDNPNSEHPGNFAVSRPLFPDFTGVFSSMSQSLAANKQTIKQTKQTT